MIRSMNQSEGVVSNKPESMIFLSPTWHVICCIENYTMGNLQYRKKWATKLNDMGCKTCRRWVPDHGYNISKNRGGWKFYVRSYEKVSLNQCTWTHSILIWTVVLLGINFSHRVSPLAPLWRETTETIGWYLRTSLMNLSRYFNSFKSLYAMNFLSPNTCQNTDLNRYKRFDSYQILIVQFGNISQYFK